MLYHLRCTVGWGNVGLRGKVGRLSYLLEISFVIKSKQGWLFPSLFLRDNKAAFSYRAFLLALSQFILKNYFIEQPTVEEFHGQEKLSPATVFSVFWLIK